MGAFSSITSPVFSELVVVLAGDALANLPQEAMLFETLHRMHELKPFLLVFSFEGPCFVQREGVWESVEQRRELNRALDRLQKVSLIFSTPRPLSVEYNLTSPSLTLIGCISYALYVTATGTQILQSSYAYHSVDLSTIVGQYTNGRPSIPSCVDTGK